MSARPGALNVPAQAAAPARPVETVETTSDPPVNKMRRRIIEMTPQQAIEELLKLQERYPTNEELLKSIP